jgi:hypothetical protein
MTLEGGILSIKHSAFNESYTKLIDSADSKGQYEKHTKKVLPEFKTLIITSKGRRSSLILKVPFIITSQPK